MSKKQLTLVRLGIVVLVVFLSGCTAPTKVRISNVERAEIAKALWEQGSDRKEGGLFGPHTIQVWPSYVAIDKPKSVVKYRLDHFMTTTYGKDIIRIVNEDSNSVVLSLKCADKDVGFIDFFRFFRSYKRNLRREREVVLGAVRQLEESENISVEWLGKWRPANQPIIVSNDGALWIAYTGSKPDMIYEYLRKRRYKKDKASSSGRIWFTREFTENPYKGGLILSTTVKGKKVKGVITWMSREKTFIKIIEIKSNSGNREPVVVLGTVATGRGVVYVREPGSSSLFSLFSFSNIKEECVDAAEELPNVVIDAVVRRATFDASGTKFVDPTPWIEDIELKPFGSECQKIYK